MTETPSLSSKLTQLISPMPDRRLAVAIFSIDAFSTINDRFGLTAGDKALAEVAERISRCAPPESLTRRFKCDQFEVVLVDVSRRVAEQFAARVLDRLADPIRIEVLAASDALSRHKPSQLASELREEQLARPQAVNSHDCKAQTS